MKLRAMLSLHGSFHKWGDPKNHDKIYHHLYRYPRKGPLLFEIPTCEEMVIDAILTAMLVKTFTACSDIQAVIEIMTAKV